jgi:hypothetical protein
MGEPAEVSEVRSPMVAMGSVSVRHRRSPGSAPGAEAREPGI